MKRVLGWLLGIAGLLLVVTVGALLWTGVPAKASGMAAKTVCSAVFVAGRAHDQGLRAGDVLPGKGTAMLALVSTSIDADQRSVTAKFLGLFPRTAALVRDRGCVLGLGPDPSAVAYVPSVDGSAPWPQGDAALPSEQWPDGVDAPALDAAVDAALVSAGDATPGVGVVYDGQLLVSRGADGVEPGTALHGWSMTKTLTAMLFHTLSSENGLQVDARVVDAFPDGREPSWVADWRTDERAQITVADLLFMRDGLENTETYAITGTVPQMLYAEPDMSLWAADRPAEVPAGQRWQYLTATTNILSAVARAQFDSDADYWAYPRAALFGPLGARSATIETDTAGTWVGGSHGWASATDWARFGQLMLTDGEWAGTEVLPPGWLELATTPAMPDGQGHGYGAQTWLIGDPDAGECRDYPGVPQDSIAMQGLWGQLVAIVPAREAVVTRLGSTGIADAFDACQFLSDVLAALPE